MKTARFLLACAAASVLAACGSDSITAPSSASSRGVAPRSGDEVTCVMITVVNADGTTTERCLDPSNSQIGSGN